MKEQMTLFVDVDGVTIDSVFAMAAWYNHKYQFTKGFVPAVGSEIYEWNAGDQMPLLQEGDIEQMFGSDLFFQVVQPIRGCYTNLKQIHDSGKFNIAFASIGSSENIARKTTYLYDKFKFIKNHFMMVKNGNNVVMDKSILHGQNAILVDDNVDNLKTTNTAFKILFKENGVDKQWNQDWDGFVATNWCELKQILEKIYNHYTLSAPLYKEDFSTLSPNSPGFPKTAGLGL